MNRERAREWTRRLRLKCLPDEPDAYSEYVRLLQASCPPGGRVVDLGCGVEGYLAFLAEQAGEIVGVDERRLEGPYNRYVQADLNREIPLEAGSVDLASAKFLLEHLSDPGQFFKKTLLALRPGGVLLLIAPNIRYYPYTVNYLLSRLLPQERRMRLVERFTARPRGDAFPVYYRCNTPRRLRMELERAGFEVLHLATYSDYLVSAVNRPLGALAVGYEKMVNLLGIKDLKGFMIVQAGKT